MMNAMPVILDWIVKPAVGAFALWLWNFSRKQYQNYQFRKMHSVSGSYIGYAEGERDGHPVQDKELLKLNQSISKATGEARSIDSIRQWDIDCEIIDGGWISGTYKSKVATDRSRGTFFLEPRLGVQGEYEGIWSGYDSGHRMVKTGKYSWRKSLEPVIERLSSDKWQEKALAILTVNLGKRYIDQASFQQYIEGKQSRQAYGAIWKGELIGVVLAQILEVQELQHFESISRQAGSKISLSAYGRVGHLRSVAVKDGFRNQGVGSSLCVKASTYLRGLGCSAVLTVAWEAGLPRSSLSLFKTLGFDNFAEIKEFWKVDDPQKDHQCPKCGFPCTCTAVFCLQKQL